MPILAADLLEGGFDTPAIRELAGMQTPTLRDAGAVFERALRQLGQTLPSRDESALIIARDLARAVLAKVITPREAAGRGASLAGAFDYEGPLMPFYAADDDYDIPGVRMDDVDQYVIDYCQAVTCDEPNHAV